MGEKTFVIDWNFWLDRAETCITLFNEGTAESLNKKVGSRFLVKTSLSPITLLLPRFLQLTHILLTPTQSYLVLNADQQIVALPKTHPISSRWSASSKSASPASAAWALATLAISLSVRLAQSWWQRMTLRPRPWHGQGSILSHSAPSCTATSKRC